MMLARRSGFLSPFLFFLFWVNGGELETKHSILSNAGLLAPQESIIQWVPHT